MKIFVIFSKKIKPCQRSKCRQGFLVMETYLNPSMALNSGRIFVLYNMFKTKWLKI